MERFSDCYTKPFSRLVLQFIYRNTAPSVSAIIVFNEAKIPIVLRDNEGVCQKVIWWIFYSVGMRQYKSFPMAFGKGNAPSLLSCSKNAE